MLLCEYLFYVYKGTTGAMNVLIMLAKDIDIDTVAEGVEQNNQINVLKGLGVDVIQGYYFDKPLRKEDMTERLRSPYYKNMQS